MADKLGTAWARIAKILAKVEGAGVDVASQVQQHSLLLTLRLGYSMSNIRTVAKLAGVSVATVSRALANPEKVSPVSLEKVHAAIRQIGYKPNMLARNFRSARSYALVVLVPDLTNPFFAELIQAVEDRAQQKGYAVLLGNTRDQTQREEDYIRRVETRLADGVIQLRPYSEYSLHPYQPADIPWVNACGVETTPTPSVRIDNVAAMATLVDHLAQLGHTTIGLVTGLAKNPHNRDRLKGFKCAVDAHQLTFKPEWQQEGDFTLWSGMQAGNYFAQLQERPTAIVCMSDQMALGLIQSLQIHGLRVPQDIAVTGFDDIPYARYGNPGITTIAQPAQAMGAAAVDMLLSLIDGQPLTQLEQVLPTALVIRGSSQASANDSTLLAPSLLPPYVE